jgi:glycosyltransferase involved in cell wall biosynthesis
MLLRLLTRIDRERFCPSVVSLMDKGAVGIEIERLGIPVYAINMRQGRPSLRGTLRLAELVRTLRPDVVHTWMYHANLLGGIAARMAGCRAVAWGIHHSNLDKEKNKRSTLWVIDICKFLSFSVPDLILSCSTKAKDVHATAGFCAAKMRVIPNGYDLHEFKRVQQARASVEQELGIPSASPLIGLLARDDPQKNHLGFVEAARQVQMAMGNAHFLLAGAGITTANARLAEAIRVAGLSEHFHLLGHRNDMPRLLSALDVLVSSSDGEAFPNILAEAMACEVPCVTTDAGDSGEIVGDTGLVSAVGDMKALAKNIISFLQKSAVERAMLGRKAVARISDRYEIGRIAKAHESFYQELYGLRACAE